jgi:uncharacterized protein with PIN domain
VTAVRFLLDEHLHLAVAGELARLGIEASNLKDLDLLGASDAALVDWARQEGWVIVTRDRDYPRMARSGMAHGGFAFYPHFRMPIGRLLQALVEVYRDETMESMRDRLIYL